MSESSLRSDLVKFRPLREGGAHMKWQMSKEDAEDPLPLASPLSLPPSGRSMDRAPNSGSWSAPLLANLEAWLRAERARLSRHGRHMQRLNVDLRPNLLALAP